MDIAICLDERDGMAFNHRRQSSDRAVVSDLLALARGRAIYLRPYSAALFPEGTALVARDDFLTAAPRGALCFVEGQPLAAVEAAIERLIIYRWHRHYPADVQFDLPLAAHGWQLVAAQDFVGHSHERITREEYER